MFAPYQHAMLRLQILILLITNYYYIQGSAFSQEGFLVINRQLHLLVFKIFLADDYALKHSILQAGTLLSDFFFLVDTQPDVFAPYQHQQLRLNILMVFLIHIMFKAHPSARKVSWQ